MKKVVQTPFDQGVVAVVEYLSGMLHGLKPEYSNYRFKKDILDELGIRKGDWTQMVNGMRHVSTSPDRQSELVGKLKRIFHVDPNFIYHYGTHKRMFLQSIVVSQTALDKELDALTNRELKQEVKALRQRLAEVQAELELVRTDCRNWQQVALQHAQLIGSLQPSISVAADAGEATERPAKNPAKPANYRPKKPRK